MNIPKIETNESKESEVRSRTYLYNLAKRKGVSHLLADIGDKLQLENIEIFKLLIHREQPDFFPEQYIPNEDYSINTQLSNCLGRSNAIYMLEKGIRNLHLELFGERDLEQEFKDKGWMK